MNMSERGIQQLNDAIMNYSGIIDDIDLSAFMQDETKRRIRSASSFKDKITELIAGHGEKGATSPWDGFSRILKFRESELTVWSGYKGHGKSLVISQAFKGFIAEGQKVFIISPEFPPHRVIHRKMIQTFGYSNLSINAALEWLEVVEGHLWLYDQQSSLKAKEIPAICKYAVNELGVDHILIDSLMKCGIPPKDIDGQKQLVDSIQQISHTSKCHVHLVAHGRKDDGDGKIGGLHDVKGASEIADMAENIVIVWRNKEKELGGGKIEEPDCIVKVEAQRNGSGEIGKIPLWFNKDKMIFKEAA